MVSAQDVHVLSVIFRAVNVENLASHRYMYVVENDINIDKATSEDSEYTVVALSQTYKDCYLRTFPLDFHRMHERSFSCPSFAASKKL